MTNKCFIKGLFTATFLVLLLFSKNLWAQQTTFRINYDFNNFDFASTAGDALTNGNYILAGWNTNIIPLTATITEVNSSGNLVWSRRYTSSISMQINDLKRDVASNTYYACGGTESGAAFIMILNSTGTPTISRNFSISQADGAFFNRIIKANDGGYVAVGYVTGYDPDGVGPEIKFNAITYTDNNGDSQTDRIGSPLIVKFDANGNHLWHHVTRYYKTSTKATTDRIYNDASFTDVVEVADGYIAVGSYDVNDHRTNTNSDGDDATSNDALFLKTTTAGAITYHRQIDAPSTTANASSKRLYSIKKTAAGLPILAGEDGSSMLFMRLPASGGWAAPTWIRRCTVPGFGTTMIVSNFVETFDGNYAAIGQYLNPFAFQVGQGIIKINSSTSTVIFGRTYDLGLFSILPNGSATADKGFISATLGAGGTNFDMQIVKTDSAGNAPVDCPAATIIPSINTPSYTYADPHYNSWNTNTVTNGSFTPVVTTPTPGVNVVCRTIACTPPPAPTVTLSNNNPICPGTSVTINASGGSNVTYRVYTQQTGGTSIGTTPRPVSPATTTTYWVEADDNANPGCVSARTSVTVNVNPAAPTQATIAGNNNPCPSSQNYTVTSANATTYTWSVSGGGSITGGQGTTNATINWTSAGNHTISVVASNSCGSVTGTYPVTVQQGPPTVTAGVTGNNFPCPVAETYTVTVSGATTYNWSVSGGGTITGNGASATVSWTTVGGPYTVSVDATNSCGTASSSTTVNVQQGPPASPNPIVGNSPVCVGSQQYAVQPVQNATGYTWSVSGGGSVTGGQGTANATINWISAGVYTVSVTANNACGNSAPQTLQVEVIPNAPNGLGAINGATTVCPGTEVYTVGGANNAADYTWTVSNGGTIVSGQGTTSIEVNWSATSGSAIISVTANNVCGSTQAATLNVTLLNGEPAAPAAIVGNNNPCPGVLNYSIANVTGASSYTWTLSGGGTIISGQGTTQIAIDWTTSGGPYTLSVVAENICGASTSTTLNIDVQQGVPLLPGNISGDDELCPGTATYSIQPVQGAVDYTWTVSGGGTITSGQGTESIVVNWTTSGGPYTVSVVANSTCASSNPSTIQVTVKNGTPATPGTITGQNTVCGGVQNYSVPTVTGAASYNWTISGGGTVTSGQGTNNITIDWTGTSGSYTISVVASNDCGISSASTLSVTILPAAPATPGQINGSTNACPIVNTYSVNDVPNATGYTWSVSGGGSIVDGQGSSTASIQWNTPGTYTVSVVASNTCGNSAPQTIEVTVNPAPSAPAVNVSNDDICEGESATITATSASGNVVYNFFDAATGGNFLGNSPLTVSPTNTTTYYLEVVNDFGCRNLGGRIPVTVNVRTAPSAAIVAAGNSNVCYGESTTLSASATPTGTTITWWSAATGGTLLGTGNTYNTGNLTENTTIYVQAEGSNGCRSVSGRTIAEVAILALPEVTLTSDKENNAVFPSEAITFTALPGSYDNYEFFVNGISVQTGPENTFASSKLFDKDSVSVIAREGACLGEHVLVVVNVRDFPNAFTPNGDGRNDFFLKGYDLVVLNRWGQELYRGIDGWDGTYDGRKVSPGTYFYILTLQNITERQNIIKGTVLLIQD